MADVAGCAGGRRNAGMSADATFTAVDLSRLPAPDIIEALDFETIFAAAVLKLQELLPGYEPRDSDPATKVLQVFAYRELLLRQRVNDSARAVMVAYAVGADLDNLGALFEIPRLVLTPADEVAGTPALMERDGDYRRRLVLAPEGYSVAGPEGAYISHALSADPDVLDASATSPAPGEVVVSVLSRTGSGVASANLLDTVQAYLSASERRPLTDFVTVQSAEILSYEVIAALTTFGGPDAAVVLAAARARLATYIEESHRLGRDVTRSGLFAALHVDGVQNVDLTAPATDIVVSRSQAAYCTATVITHTGVGE